MAHPACPGVNLVPSPLWQGKCGEMVSPRQHQTPKYNEHRRHSRDPPLSPPTTPRPAPPPCQLRFARKSRINYEPTTPRYLRDRPYRQRINNGMKTVRTKKEKHNKKISSFCSLTPPHPTLFLIGRALPVVELPLNTHADRIWKAMQAALVILEADAVAFTAAAVKGASVRGHLYHVPGTIATEQGHTAPNCGTSAPL